METNNKVLTNCREELSMSPRLIVPSKLVVKNLLLPILLKLTQFTFDTCTLKVIPLSWTRFRKAKKNQNKRYQHRAPVFQMLTGNASQLTHGSSYVASYQKNILRRRMQVQRNNPLFSNFSRTDNHFASFGCFDKSAGKTKFTLEKLFHAIKRPERVTYEGKSAPTKSLRTS